MKEKDVDSKGGVIEGITSPNAGLPEQDGIASVNQRNGGSTAAKVFFVLMVVGVLAVGGTIGFNKYRAATKEAEASAGARGRAAQEESKPAAVGRPRQFDEKSAVPSAGAAGSAPAGGGTAVAIGLAEEGKKPTVPGQTAGPAPAQCADGTVGTVLVGPDGKALVGASGAIMRSCKDGRILVPEVAPAPPGTVAPGQGAGGGSATKPVSRYAGAILVPAPAGQSNDQASQQAADPVAQILAAQAAQQRALMGGSQGGAEALGSAGKPSASPTNQPPNPPGSIGSMLSGSSTPPVQASLIGDRNMILPKGRSIDCGMTMRLVNEVAGMASCVLSQDVFSDNGRVLLLEKGSEVEGEYVAAMAQGQRRLFVLWTRVKTPHGVRIALNSPAADELGTSGMAGYVDNHWWERLGAAFLLSFVQDVIAAETAGKQSGQQGAVLYQQTAQTGNRMAEKVLDSTINIKPTLYKNQGDRASIYVARDLDFGSVYAIRNR